MYHVLLDEGRRLGPFDRRTIVGMRVKKALTSKHVLVAADGARLTVAELVYQAPGGAGLVVPSPGAQEDQPAGTRSVVQGIHPARLLEVEGAGLAVPPFKDEIEVRVQTRVLRIAGRFRDGLGWKEDRVKVPLEDIPHARLRGTIVDLWIRAAGQQPLQRISLDLLDRDAAGELAEALPLTSPYPGSEPLAARSAGRAGLPAPWVALAVAVVFVVGVAVWAVVR
jgi:hypothetical protein